ncbi:MAG: hypothetical protein QXU98_10225, partial [Candidatus Parvarchaeota archaeon]
MTIEEFEKYWQEINYNKRGNYIGVIDSLRQHKPKSTALQRKIDNAIDNLINAIQNTDLESLKQLKLSKYGDYRIKAKNFLELLIPSEQALLLSNRIASLKQELVWANFQKKKQAAKAATVDTTTNENAPENKSETEQVAETEVMPEVDEPKDEEKTQQLDGTQVSSTNIQAEDQSTSTRKGRSSKVVKKDQEQIQKLKTQIEQIKQALMEAKPSSDNVPKLNIQELQDTLRALIKDETQPLINQLEQIKSHNISTEEMNNIVAKLQNKIDEIAQMVQVKVDDDIKRGLNWDNEEEVVDLTDENYDEEEEEQPIRKSVKTQKEVKESEEKQEEDRFAFFKSWKFWTILATTIVGLIIVFILIKKFSASKSTTNNNAVNTPAPAPVMVSTASVPTTQPQAV